MAGGDDLLFPPVPQPAMRQQHVGPGSGPVHATIDNQTGLPDGMVQQAIEDRWIEVAGLQFAQPSSFSLYATTNQGSMLARTPFRTPTNVIDEIKLARTFADTDDDVGATLGMMVAIAFGKGMMNQHRDETTLEFFNQMADPKVMDLEGVFEELYREYLIAGSVTTLSLFLRQRMSYYPLKSVEPILAQLQVPRIGILPAENIRVISNDIIGQGELAFHVEDYNLKNWLDEFFNPRTPNLRKSMMASEEPVAAALFTGRREIPFTDGDAASRGMTVYTLNQRMVHRTSMPKGALPYARPLLTRNFPLLEAKRLLNIMDYALLQGGTNYIVIAKKGSDKMPAQPQEIQNLQNQVMHASRSGVLVGDHRLDVQIVTPNLEELLNSSKRKLLGRKIAMALLRQSEQVTGDPGTKGAENEMELTARVVESDRRKLVRHIESSTYGETANRNRATFKEGAPTIWGPPIVLTEIREFWKNILNASDRGLIPHRYTVEALGYDYEATLAEREREIARGDDQSLVPGSVPYSSPEAGPQDNNEGRPPGSSRNNGRPGGPESEDPQRHPGRRVIRKLKGETVQAIVQNNEVAYIGETTRALLVEYEDRMEIGYVTSAEREAIECNQAIRTGPSVILPVNPGIVCSDFRTAKLEDGLRVVIGRRRQDDALVAKALRFTEPHFDVKSASEYALRWGFVSEPLVEVAGKKRCVNCGNEMPDYSEMNPVCPSCNYDNTPGTTGGEGGPMPGGSAETGRMLTAIIEASDRRHSDLVSVLRDALKDIASERKPEPGEENHAYTVCPNCGLIQASQNGACERCTETLDEPTKALMAYLEDQGIEFTAKPPSQQPDRREDGGWDADVSDPFLVVWARSYRDREQGQ